MIKLWLDGGVWIFVPCRRYQRHTSLHTSQQEEFQELKAKVKASGKRKDVTVPWSNIASYIVHHYLTLWLVNPLFSRKGCLEGLILPFVAGCGSPSQIYPWVNTKFRQKLSLWGVFAVWARRAIPGSGAVCCHEGGVWQAGNQPLGPSNNTHIAAMGEGVGGAIPQNLAGRRHALLGTQGQHRRNTSPTYRTRAVSTSIPAVEWNKNIKNVGIKMTR
jgi:hypothetical protein